MKKLRFLSIRNNRLVDLPKSIGSADHLRVIKLDGNPLSEALWSIVNGNQVSTSSPPNLQVNENDIAVEVTQQIKNFLKDSSPQTDSELGSQSEGPLETARSLRRISARFPVKLSNGNSSEAGLELRSPGNPKPAIPTRSKQRIFSGSNGSTQVAKRSGASPLHIANERNRSQSESIVQATANARNKRMGMLSARKLDSLEESNTNRNSLHLRGTSHASALRGRHNIYKSAIGSGSTTSLNSFDGSATGILLHRLSSVPERRSDSIVSRRIIEIARGVVYALHMFDPCLHILLSVLVDVVTPGRISIQSRYGSAISKTKQLDQDLSAFDSRPPKSGKAQRKAVKSIKNTCTECLMSYKQIFQELYESTASLVTKADRRYLRTLMLVFYGSCNEAFNGALSAVPQEIPPLKEAFTQPKTLPIQRLPRLTIQPANSSKSDIPLAMNDGSRTIAHVTSQDSSLASYQITSQGPFSAPTRRLRSETLTSSRSGNTIKPPPMPQSALPAFTRSRSNSRTTQLGSVLSMTNTPRSGESFLMQSSASSQSSQEYEQVELERVYGSISMTITQCYTKMSDLISRVKFRMGYIQMRREREACQRLIIKFETLRNTCEVIHKQMVEVKLNDPDTRRFRELCQAFINYAARWESFLTSMVPEKKDHPDIWSASDMKDLKPLHERHKLGASDVQAYLHKPNNPEQNWGAHSVYGGGNSTRRNGHDRGGRGDSNGSIISPYIPTTPLSAALGAAAQATIPAVPPASAASTGSTFDRSFKGNVFERADALLNSNTLPFLRNRERAL